MFSAIPVNFGRIEAMMRSGSRSNSPEHELHQMTSTSASSSELLSAQINSHTSAEKHKNKKMYSEQHKEEHNKTTIRSRSENSKMVDSNKPSLSESSSSSSLSLQVISRESINNATSEEKDKYSMTTFTNEYNNTKEGVNTCKSIHNIDDRIQLTQFDENVVMPCVWHYGSILYYPVTCRFYCWNGHPLELRLENAENSEAGVSCDFCGYTLWNEDLNDTDKKVNEEHTKETTMQNNAQSKKITLECHSYSPESQQSCLSSSSSASRSLPSSSSVRFYHCATCTLDFCNMCIRDIVNNVRFHVPCMQCERCGEFVAIHTSAIHRCKLQRKRTWCKCADEHQEKEEKQDDHIVSTNTVNKVVASREENRSNHKEVCDSDSKVIISNTQATVEQQYIKRMWENSKPLSRKLQKRNRAHEITA